MEVMMNDLEVRDRELDGALETNAAVIRLFKARNDQQGSDELWKLLDAIWLLYAMTSEDVAGPDPYGIEIPRKQIPAMLERALGQIISAQESQSWLVLCDILEYEITPILESWKVIVTATRAGN